MIRRLALAALLAAAPSIASAQFATIGATPPVTDNSDRLATTQWVNNFFALGIPLASGKIFVGSAAGLATAQSMSGDCTLTASGIIICPSSNGVAFGALAFINGGAGVSTALAAALNGTGGLVGFSGALGTPTSGVGTNLTGTAAGLTAGHVTTNANLTGDITSVGNATTLATVNSNTGAIGSATQCVTVTNNAKGLTTAVTAATCTPAIGSVTGLGTGNATLLGTATGTAGGPVQLIATGTAALGTSAIASGACATTVTVSATNVATTDVIDTGFNANPTSITGYTAPNMLSIVPFPSANNVNFAVCNNTAASITPGAITLNWKVRR